MKLSHQDRRIIGVFLGIILCFSVPVSFAEYTSPNKQLESGVEPEKIQCKKDRILVLRTDGSAVCVTENTAKKFADKRGWKIIIVQEPTPDVKTSQDKSTTIPETKDIDLKKEEQSVTKNIVTGNLVLSYPRLEDTFGATINEVWADRPVKITADITNTGDAVQNFAYIVTVINENNEIIKDGQISAELEPQQTFSGGIMWTPPPEYGTYTIDIKVSDSITSNVISDSEQLVVTIDNAGGSIQIKGEPEKIHATPDAESLYTIEKFFEENTVRPSAYENPREFAEKLMTVIDDKILEEKEFRNGIHFYTEKGHLRIQFSGIHDDVNLPTYKIKNQHAIKLDDRKEFVNNFMEKMGYHRDGSEYEQSAESYYDEFYFFTVQTLDNGSTWIEHNKITFYFKSAQTIIHIGSWHNNINSLDLPINLNEAENIAYRYVLTSKILQDPNGSCYLNTKNPKDGHYIRPDMNLSSNEPKYLIDVGHCQKIPTIGSVKRITIKVDAITGDADWTYNIR